MYDIISDMLTLPAKVKYHMFKSKLDSKSRLQFSNPLVHDTKLFGDLSNQVDHLTQAFRNINTLAFAFAFAGRG